jgi:hypothetical protein
MSDQVDSNNISDEQVDQLLSGDQPNRERAISEAPAAADASAAPWKEDQFTANGKPVKGTREQILQWASMGYNYPQKAAELNKAQMEWQRKQQETEAQWKEREQKWAPYKEVDQYAAKNPDWWTQVQSAFKERVAGAQSNPEVAQIKQEFQELKSWIEQQKNEKQTQATEAQDKALASDIESIRKQYTNIDFDTPDSEGVNLEMKVLKHAMEMGLDGSKPGHFKAAFRDYYHDDLVSRAREEAKANVSKDIQKRSKLGILGESSKPTKGLKGAEGVKNKSYDQLMREGLEELGIG